VKLDLVVVSAYSVGESRIVVPRRIDPAHEEWADPAGPTQVKSTTQTVEGGQAFLDAIAQAADEHRAGLRQLYEWASVNGQVKVPAGGQLKVPTPRGLFRVFWC
ncbi:MAG TPA: hypothetical protein VFG00_09695, partial [Acidothermaceae bacterium]|nr:hypothetical protein [Acidothermaceae bacterium]